MRKPWPVPFGELSASGMQKTDASVAEWDVLTGSRLTSGAAPSSLIDWASVPAILQGRWQTPPLAAEHCSPTAQVPCAPGPPVQAAPLPGQFALLVQPLPSDAPPTHIFVPQAVPLGQSARTLHGR